MGCLGRIAHVADALREFPRTRDPLLMSRRIRFCGNTVPPASTQGLDPPINFIEMVRDERGQPGQSSNDLLEFIEVDGERVRHDSGGRSRLEFDRESALDRSRRW